MSALNQNNPTHLHALTRKHLPFTGAKLGEQGKRFTYKNIHGSIMNVRKRKYTWTDPTKLDKDGKPAEERKEAVLKNEDLGSYNFEEYETNEFERVSIACEWDNSQILLMLQAAPAKLETDLKEMKKRQGDIDKKQAEIDKNLVTVVTNYMTLHTTYENVRMEIQAMAVELPALKGTPYDRPYFTSLTPVVENLAKIHFPALAKDVMTVPQPAPAPVVTPVATTAYTAKA